MWGNIKKLFIENENESVIILFISLFGVIFFLIKYYYVSGKTNRTNTMSNNQTSPEDYKKDLIYKEKNSVRS